jgi:hypothetical protein
MADTQAPVETDADVIAALRLGLEGAADDRTALRLVRALLEMAPPTEGRAAHSVDVLVRAIHSTKGSMWRRETAAEPRTCETPQDSPWRVGQKVGRTIYVMVGGEAGDEDELIGVMDSGAIAAAAVEAHNDTLRPWSACCGFPVRLGPVTGPICAGCLEPCDVR